MSQQPPRYARHHKHYARVKIDGVWIHLGAYDSEESRAKYKRLITEWAAGQPAATAADTSIKVCDVLETYRVWALKQYGDIPRSRYRNLLPVIRTVRLLYADLPAHEFSPKKLKTVRQAFIEKGNSRGTVNDYTRAVIAIFRWAAEEELVPGSIVHSLQAVRSLQRGRCDVREGKRVETIDQATVDATIDELTVVVADMIRLQLVSGARPGEICTLTPGQIDRTGDVWLYRPEQHKTAWKGRERVVCFGPQAQDILRKYLLRPANTPCFSPKESLAQHMDAAHEARTTPMNEGNKPSLDRRAERLATVGDQYDVPAYRKAVYRACDRASPAPEGLEGQALRDWKAAHRWGPHRLRHTRATEVRDQFGLDGAQAILGHAHARVTEIYGELNVAKAADIARQIG